MDRNKFREQARVLRQKKLSRMAAQNKQRPTVEQGVVKFNVPIAKKAADIRIMSAMPTPNKAQTSILSKSQNMPPMTPQPQQIVQKPRGCSGCKRNIKK